MPFRCTACGITLKAFDEVSNEVTETTTCATGSTLRLAMVCSAMTTWLATSGRVDGLVRLGGVAALALDCDLELVGRRQRTRPGRIAKLPTGRPGQLCMP